MRITPAKGLLRVIFCKRISTPVKCAAGKGGHLSGVLQQVLMALSQSKLRARKPVFMTSCTSVIISHRVSVLTAEEKILSANDQQFIPLISKSLDNNFDNLAP